MNAGTIRFLFLGLLLVKTVWESVLVVLNMRTIRKHADRIPDMFQGTINEETYRKSVNYSLEKNRFELVSGILEAGLLIVFVFSGLLGSLDVLSTQWSIHPYLQGAFYIFLISLLFRIVTLPLSLYSQFVIEARYGFNRMTLRLFFIDFLKGLVIQLILLLPIVAVLFWFMETTGELWWVWAFVFVTLFQVVVTILYPLVIAPLFNKFTPLEEGSLKEQILNLAERLGFRTRGIFVMDSSRRTQHANAYFTGLGRVKRIVLFDTLLAVLSNDEIAAVLAHEIGHEKRKHIVRMFLVSSVFLILGLLVLNALLSYAPLYEAFYFQRISYQGILVIISFCSGPFTFFLTPLINAFSRRHEYQADRFAAEQAGLGKALASALLTLGKENLTNLTPHPWYSFYYYSHPTLSERIQALEASSSSAA
ncbi:MAG TPA: M48 family metallopeptidase [Spirochaetales bacterium]|nr:M48 family metallopeptidase [Spirochaetales bacterium]